MLGRDLGRAIDPMLLAVDCGIVPDPWQAELLRSSAPRVLLLCARQTGKTTITALEALKVALFQSGALILIVSPSQRQSAEMFRTVMALYRKLKGVPAVSAESVLRAEFSNGSRIIALPGNNNVRGFAGADLIIVDEASRCEDTLISIVRPMMATKAQGRLIALSTPAGKRGWYYEAWTGSEEWHRVKVPASECPRISAAFLAEELRELGPTRFSEEYELAFIDDSDSVFASAIIDAAFSDSTLVPLWQ